MRKGRLAVNKREEIHHTGEASFGVQDGMILEHYGVNELHFDSVKNYRNRFLAVKPNHPWNGLETKEFLYKIGAWGKRRETGKEGLTLAGLLMFSEERIITEVLPHYFLEYRDETGTAYDERWTDRITSQDGTWSGNLFDFYFMVMPRLIAGLKVPFQLQGTLRQDETAVHTALREALVNAIVHADYSGERGIVVTKESDGFVFSNPGTLRVPPHQAFAGGVSDLRNPNVCKMFLLIGLGERAGSGLSNIRQTWREQEWKIPQISQQESPARTTFILRMISASESEIEAEKRTIESSLNKEGWSANKEINSINKEFKSVNNEFYSVNKRENSLNKGINSDNNEWNSLNNWLNSYNKKIDSVNKSVNKRTLASFEKESKEWLQEDNVEEHVGPEAEEGATGEVEKVEVKEEEITDEELWQMAEIARKRKRLSPKVMEEVILRLCAQKPLRLKELADMLERTPDGLRNNYLGKLLKENKLRLKYPDQVNHPKQAYITVK